MNNATANGSGPLDNVRIIEMGQLLAGPFASQILGDFGAEIIKVEPPGEGDPMRQWGREKPYGKSLWWPVIARNKKSITLNLRTEAGQETLRELVRHADVVIENFRAGRLEKWNLGYDVLSEINPRLILTRVTGYGQTGPYSARAGFGSIGEAMGGLRYITGSPDGMPSRVGVSIGDQLAGTMGAIGTLVALHARERTGRGQVVDSAIFEAVLSYMESMIPEYQIAGYIRERTGAILPNVAPSNVYPTADDQMVLIAANQDAVFRRLTDAMDRPELAEDPRYATHSARGQSQQELDDLIAEWTRTMSSDVVLELMETHAVPAGRIYRAPEMLEDPHFAARESIVRLQHRDFGEFPLQNVAPKLSDTPGQVRWLGPELGEHNQEILGDLLGLDDERITAATSE
ncbi:MAG: CoA transferase [Acidimicrobiia bacterium]|nr:CoA transferase [Acidimicrobiia bacterium]